ncbi:CatB-related O-acetyltransferase [Dysgonomonas sp. GY617]|uniref:CatB-related O-acetyltransferase n=1 Tax=Dysgonomonas sp. GY617 TaxID=2780420 RepID=UPI00188444DB|nr:CatB-related O-acetyltransferase [Dysgonomonas sp. GY617]MBF0576526.1 CatB-related O-acetyltransferase [Dysgonomonas sp. GY617]
MINFIRNIPIVDWLVWKFKIYMLLSRNKGKHIEIGKNATVFNSSISDYNSFYENVVIDNCHIQRFVYVSFNTRIANAVIGSFCSIGPNCLIGQGEHPIDHISTFPAFFSTYRQCQISFCNESKFNESTKTIIGNDVWLGANVIVLNGVSIGNGAIIAAGAVVTKDVPAYSIVGGIPAKILKYRFSDDRISFLQDFKWWEKDIDWIKINAHLFCEPNKFFTVYEK